MTGTFLIPFDIEKSRLNEKSESSLSARQGDCQRTFTIIAVMQYQLLLARDEVKIKITQTHTHTMYDQELD